jgi:hypothetical protein
VFNATSQAGYTAQNFVWTTNSATPNLVVTNYPFTIACWMQTSNYYPSSAEPVLWNQEWLYLGDGTQSAQYYALGIPTVAPGSASQSARNTTAVFNNSSVAITNGAWHHVVGVYNSATSRILYVDGIAANTNTTSVNIVARLNRIGIGGLTRSAPTDEANGGIADVGIWVTNLSPQKVALVNGLGLFERLPLNNPAIDALGAVYNTQSGTVQVGADIWGYTNGLSGVAGATGGSISSTNAYIVLDSAGHGVQMLGVAPKPFIVSFTVNPLAIVLGSTVTLNWSVFNATSVTIDQGIGPVSASGTLTVTPTNTTTWTLTASSAGGTVTNAVTASVNTSPIVSYFTDDLPANLGQYYPGDAVTLSWSVSNADTVAITPGVGSVPATGTVVVHPTVTTTYILASGNSYSTNITTTALTVPVGLPQPPVAYYPLNETGGTTAHDASGNGRDLITTSSPNSGGLNPAWEPTGGPIGGGIMFNATAQNNTSQAFLWTTNSASPALVLTNFPFTLACWMQVPNYQFGWSQEWLYFGDSTSGANYYALGIQAGLGTASQQARSGGNQVYNNSTAGITDGNWHHVVGVFLSPTDRILYLDGVAANTSTPAVTMIPCNRIAIGALMRLGQTDAVNGGLADVGIWAQGLPPEQVALINGLGVFEQLPLTNSAIAALEAVYHAGSGTVKVGPHAWGYANGLSGAAGSTGGSVATMDAYIVLDDAGNGVALKTGAQPFIVSFTVSPSDIVLGSTVTLSWSVLNADRVQIDQGIGPVSASGTLALTPANTTTWTLSASNAAGIVTYPVTVSVNSSPIINYFTIPANVYQSYPGDSVTLSWSVTNATTQQITPGVGSVPATGTVVVNPTVTTTYILAASNTYSTNVITNALTVVVLPLAPPQLVIYWGCNEGSGTNLFNSVSTNWTGNFKSIYSNPTWTAGAGVFGGPALSFISPNAGENVAVRATGAAVTNYPFTLLAWYNAQYNSGTYTLASLPSSRSTADFCSLGVNNGLPLVSTSYNPFGNTVNTAEADASQVVADANWHQLVGVFESSYDRKIYVDGVLGADAFGTNVAFDVPYCFSIGDLDVVSGTGPNATVGYMDEVALYSGRLLSNDVAIIYGAASGLGLNTPDAEALRSAFQPGASGYAYATNLLWQRVAAVWPGKAIGATGGTIGGQNAYEVMDAAGDGMQVVTNLKPTIASPPQSQTNYAGATVTFSVQAFSSQPINYQWFSSVSGALSGQTNATLTLASIQLAQAGSYSVQVTNSLGGNTSTPAVLTVVPPRIAQPKILPDGHFGFVANGIQGTICTIRSSASVIGPWTILTNITVGASGVISFEDPTTPPPTTQFYEALFK